MEKEHKITDLQYHAIFPIIPKSDYGREIRYEADFVYKENGKTIVEDVKGYRTQVYKLKRRLMAEVHKVVIRET